MPPVTWKLTVGGSFLLGAIFWAGAMYNQVVDMRGEVSEIKAQLPALGKVAVLEMQELSMQSQINRLQDQLDKIKRVVE